MRKCLKSLAKRLGQLFADRSGVLASLRLNLVRVDSIPMLAAHSSRFCWILANLLFKKQINKKRNEECFCLLKRSDSFRFYQINPLKTFMRVMIAMGKMPVNQQQHQPRPSTLFSICEVRPHLFIAGYASLEETKLRQLSITHAVDVTNIPKTKRFPGIQYLEVPIDDSLMANAAPHFQRAADFVKGGKAVIYCAAGVSRAATITLMCLVINEGITLRDAYYTVVRARPIIAPNLAFWRQMIAWEVENKGQASVQLLKGMRTPVPDVYLHKSDYMPPPETWAAPPKYALTPTMDPFPDVYLHGSEDLPPPRIEQYPPPRFSWTPPTT